MKTETVKRLYFVEHGPDVSHLWDSGHFDSLKDAFNFAANLPKTPFGEERPFKIIMAKYKRSRVYGDTVEFIDVLKSF